MAQLPYNAYKRTMYTHNYIYAAVPEISGRLMCGNFPITYSQESCILEINPNYPVQTSVPDWLRQWSDDRNCQQNYSCHNILQTALTVTYTSILFRLQKYVPCDGLW